jgi:hypothetical protein
VVRRATGPARLLRRKREEKVELAAEEAAIVGPAFTPEAVKAAARDRAALANLIGADLMIEWGRRPDDFDRKGWQHITERLSETAVEYLGVVNREGEAEDRVTVRIEAEIRDYTVDASGHRLLRTDDTDEVTRLPEYWTLGRSLPCRSTATPGPPLSICPTSTVASIPTCSRRPPAVRWPAAPKRSTATTPLFSRSPRRPPSKTCSMAATRPSARASSFAVPSSSRSAFSAVDPHGTPATMTVAAELTGCRYRENRDTTTVVDGDKDKDVTFTESWTRPSTATTRHPGVWRARRRPSSSVPVTPRP